MLKNILIIFIATKLLYKIDNWLSFIQLKKEYISTILKNSVYIYTKLLILYEHFLHTDFVCLNKNIII